MTRPSTDLVMDFWSAARTEGTRVFWLGSVWEGLWVEAWDERRVNWSLIVAVLESHSMWWIVVVVVLVLVVECCEDCCSSRSSMVSQQ